MTLEDRTAWVHRGFEDFALGRFDDGGSNLYVNAKGIIEMIHRTDLNNDGYVDIVLANEHGYIERGPTWIYTQADGPGKDWPRHELPNDSGWMSRIKDVDGDGYPDLIVVNGENGVTSELDSYIYWGGPRGLTGERTALPTAGAYDVAVFDFDGDGRKDVVFPSAWVDHHNAGRARPLHVYLQTAPRQFEDAGERCGLVGYAATSVAAADLTGNGFPDLVVANYRDEFEYDTDSFVYWGSERGFDPERLLRLPTHYAHRVLLADLDGDGRKEIIFCGGDEVCIYWNERGSFSAARRTIVRAEGFATMFTVGAVHAVVADVDGDGRAELILGMKDGVQIRRASDLHKVEVFIPLEYAGWVHAADLDGDGRPELIVSRYEDGTSYDTESAIFWNSPSGFSPERVTWLPTSGARGCTAGDLDGDGVPEIIFNNTLLGPSQTSGTFPLYVYLGGRDCDYGVHRRVELPCGGASSYVIADFDLDGEHELATVAGTGARIFRGGPGGPWPDRYYDVHSRGTTLMQCLAADFNRDGWLDLLVTSQTYDDKPETMAASTTIFYGSAEGFSEERSEVLPTFSWGMACLADVDKDGYLDIIMCDKRGYITVFLGGPDGFLPERVQNIPWCEHGSSSITVADLNGNGWLDLIVGVMCHYERGRDTIRIYFGGPEGYSLENSYLHNGVFSPGVLSVADLNNDGKLDLVAPAYSTDVSRELPLRIFWGEGRSFDFEHPLVIEANSPCSSLLVDLTRNGWLDLVLACHRNDLGHQVDSLIFWNGPEGISRGRATPIPGMGPHYMAIRDFGNSYTREPLERYTSPPCGLDGRSPERISWKARVPETTGLKFQLRWAESEAALEDAPWSGPDGEGTCYEKPGAEVRGVPRAALWLQYRATFVSPYGVASPQLEEVRIDLHNED